MSENSLLPGQSPFLCLIWKMPIWTGPLPMLACFLLENLHVLRSCHKNIRKLPALLHKIFETWSIVHSKMTKKRWSSQCSYHRKITGRGDFRSPEEKPAQVSWLQSFSEQSSQPDGTPVLLIPTLSCAKKVTWRKEHRKARLRLTSHNYEMKDPKESVGGN